jgi:flagellar motility protein MotE (MotC chaperone)
LSGHGWFWHTRCHMGSRIKVRFGRATYMTENKDNQPIRAPKDEAPQAVPAKKSGLMKYIIFGAVGLVAVLVVAFATVFLLGGFPQKPKDAQAKAGIEVKPADSVAARETPLAVAPLKVDDTMKKIVDSITGTTEDTSIMAEVKRNLAALEYVPDLDTSRGLDSAGVAKESVAALSWVNVEKDKLREKEKSLNIRDVEVSKREQEVSRKLIKIEQVTATRISELARLYDGMDVRAVANMMASLDDTTIVSILPRMKQKNASQVLGLLPAQRGAKLSKQMIEVAEN